MEAVKQYQKADEAAGFLTDYALRRTEALWGAAQYLSQAGDIERARELSTVWLFKCSKR